MTRIGILGFGEAGSAFAAALSAAGAKVYGYDLAWQGADDARLAQLRDEHSGIEFCRLSELLAEMDIVLSTVTTDAALDAAEASLLVMMPGQVYCDLNSTAPRIKRQLAEMFEASDALFVEGAILGAIGVSGAKTRILLGGGRARELSEILNGLGLNTEAYSREIGKASTFKMLRSVFSKGLEALLIEFLAAGRKAGLEDDLWREVTELMADGRFEEVARNWICSHATAHERRNHEMLQVNELLNEMSFDAIMSEATGRFFERSTALGLADEFAARPAETKPVVDALLRRLSRGTGK
ncbi:MAG: NAD(P)-binding domain-containing protein [Gammaproteobacteria bacterium]|jgi:3-hydroxyisobutyrate dehydrogenase-like beta-hydroxyacid dehydrogenase